MWTPLTNEHTPTPDTNGPRQRMKGIAPPIVSNIRPKRA